MLVPEHPDGSSRRTSSWKENGKCLHLGLQEADGCHAWHSTFEKFSVESNGEIVSTRHGLTGAFRDEELGADEIQSGAFVAGSTESWIVDGWRQLNEPWAKHDVARFSPELFRTVRQHGCATCAAGPGECPSPDSSPVSLPPVTPRNILFPFCPP